MFDLLLDLIPIMAIVSGYAFAAIAIRTGQHIEDRHDFATVFIGESLIVLLEPGLPGAALVLSITYWGLLGLSLLGN